MVRLSLIPSLLIAASLGGCVATGEASGPAPAVAMRSRVQEVDDDPPEIETLDDASTGFPAINEDGTAVAVLEAQDDLAGELSMAVAFFHATGGSPFEQLVLLSPAEATDGARHPGALPALVERRARAVNERLRRDGYTAMPRVECATGCTSLRIEDIDVALDGGRFRVTNARGGVRLDVDASGWQSPPVRTPSLTCVTHPAIRWASYDRARSVLAVEITPQIDEGGDSCPTPSSFGVFSMRGDARHPA
jgi:hypothetical protein